MSVDKETYEADLKKRQEEHLNRVQQNRNLDNGFNKPFPYGPIKTTWKPCLHDGCTECIGTGIKRDGSTCIHYISCQCPKCSPFINQVTVKH